MESRVDTGVIELYLFGVRDQDTALGGGFKHFLFSYLFGEMIQVDEYFSDGLVQPPTSFGSHFP